MRALPTLAMVDASRLRAAAAAAGGRGPPDASSSPAPPMRCSKPKAVEDSQASLQRRDRQVEGGQQGVPAAVTHQRRTSPSRILIGAARSHPICSYAPDVVTDTSYTLCWKGVVSPGGVHLRRQGLLVAAVSRGASIGASAARKALGQIGAEQLVIDGKRRSSASARARKSRRPRCARAPIAARSVRRERERERDRGRRALPHRAAARASR